MRYGAMMQLTVFLLWAIGVASADVESAFEKAGIVPNVIDKAPERRIEIKYRNGRVHFGNELTPTQTKHVPEVHYHHECKAFYTLALIDPDAKLNGQPTIFEHWLIGNIPGDKVSKGEILTEYVGAAPPKGDKSHRYVFLLYKQKGAIKFNETIISNTNANRSEFSVENFAKKYNLIGAVAGNFFTAKYDNYAPTIYRQLGLAPKCLF